MLHHANSPEFALFMYNVLYNVFVLEFDFHHSATGKRYGKNTQIDRFRREQAQA